MKLLYILISIFLSAQVMGADDAPPGTEVEVFLGSGFWPGGEPCLSYKMTVPSNMEVVRFFDIQGGPPTCDLWAGGWSAPPFALNLVRNDKSYNILHIDRDGKLTPMDKLPGGHLENGDKITLLTSNFEYAFADERNHAIESFIRRFKQPLTIPEIVAAESLADLELAATSSADKSSDSTNLNMLAGDNQTRRWLYALKRDAAFMEAGNRTRIRFHIAGTPISTSHGTLTRQTYSVVFSANGRTLRSGSLTFSYVPASEISRIRGSVRVESAFVSTMPADVYFIDPSDI